jgi:hypothetical protein
MANLIGGSDTEVKHRFAIFAGFPAPFIDTVFIIDAK